MRLSCAIITPKTRKIAKEIGKSDIFTVSLISLYQTETGKTNPSADDLKEFLRKHTPSQRDGKPNETEDNGQELAGQREAYEKIAKSLVGDPDADMGKLSDSKLYNIIKSAGKVFHIHDGESNRDYMLVGDTAFDEKGEKAGKAVTDNALAARDIKTKSAVGVGLEANGTQKEYAVYPDGRVFSFGAGKLMSDTDNEDGITKELVQRALESKKPRRKAKADQPADNTIKTEKQRSGNTEFDKTLNDIINGRRQFNNLTEEENDVARRDRLLAAGEVASRLHGITSRKESQDERNERQEKQVEQWAKSAGVWHDDAISYGKSFGNEVHGGQESRVYVNYDHNSVIKVKNTTQYHDLREFLDGIVLHNTLFPETAYKVLGFGNDGEGFVAILEQPFVKGTEPTQEQITEFVKSRVPGAEMYEEDLGNGRYKTSQTLLHDLSPRNAIITPNGNIAIIDDVVRPNTASEGKGGQRSEDYSISNDTVIRQLLDHMAKGLGLKLHFKAEAEEYLKKHGGKGIMAAMGQGGKTLEDILSPHTMEAARTGKWDDESIEEFNNLINDIQNGKIHFKRVRRETTAYTEGISQAHAGASCLIGGSLGAGEAQQRNPQAKRTAAEQYEEDARQGREQERIIEAWAKAEDLWLNDYEDGDGNKAATLEDLLDSQWHHINQGSEAEVYLYDENTVLKSINLSHANDNVAKVLDRIALFNKLFPNTAIQVVGFGRDALGHFRIIVTQPYIKGQELTDAELADFRRKQGFADKKGWITLPDGTARITDLGNYNILKDGNGNYFVIDADIEYLTPAYGGSVEFDNTFTDSSESPDGMAMFQTPQGEVYGFVTKSGDMYLDETKITPEHLMHEYAHLWDMVVKAKNPALWKKGVELLKQYGKGKLWGEIAGDPNYGGKWKAAGISGERLDNLIASEAHARLVGENGEKMLDDAAKEKGQKGIVSKVRKWLLDIWKSLKSTLGISGKDIDNLKLKDFNHMTVRDFFADEIEIQRMLDEITVSVGGADKIKASEFSFGRKGAHPALRRKPMDGKNLSEADTTPPTDSSEDVRKTDGDDPFAKINKAFTAKERHARVAMIGRMFHDGIVEAVVGAEEYLMENMNGVDDPVAREAMQQEYDLIHRAAEKSDWYDWEATHAALRIPGFGVDYILNLIREWLAEEANDERRSDRTRGQYAACIDNLPMLLREAANDIEWRDGLRLTFKPADSGAKAVSAGEGETDDGMRVAEEEFSDDEEGNRVPGNAGWSYSVRETSPRDTLGRKVRSVIDSLAVHDSDNAPVMDDLDFPTYLDHEYVHAVLLNELADIKSPDEFAVWNPEKTVRYKKGKGAYDFPALERIVPKYPWVKIIIGKLSRNPELVPAFYSDLRMDFISYWGAFKNRETGKWRNARLNNTNLAEDVAYTVTTLYDHGGKAGKKTVFLGHGRTDAELAKEIRREYFKLETSLVISTATEREREQQMGRLKESSLEQKNLDKLSGEQARELAQWTRRIVEAVGFELPAGAAELAVQDISKFNRTIGPALKILNIIKETKVIDGKLMGPNVGVETDEDNRTDLSTAGKLYHAIGRFYMRLAENIGAMNDGARFGTFRQEGKQYYSYSAPNYMDTQLKYFLDDKTRKEYIDSHFRRFGWYYRENPQDVLYDDDGLIRLTTTPIDYENQGRYGLDFLPKKVYRDFFKDGGYKERFILTKDELERVRFNRETHHWELAPGASKYVRINSLTTTNVEEKIERINGFIDLIREHDRMLNEWVYMIENEPGIREKLEFKEVKTVKDAGKDKGLRHTTYENWTPSQVSFAMIQEFLSANELDWGVFRAPESDSSAWYSFPIFSDSKVMKYVRFRRYVDNMNGTVEEKVNKRLARVAMQELWRIRHVGARKAARERGENVREIANYDSKGSGFCFFREFNDYVAAIGADGSAAIYDTYKEDVPPGVEAASLLDTLLGMRTDTERRELLELAVGKFMQDKFGEFKDGLEKETDDELADYVEANNVVLRGNRNATMSDIKEKILRDYFWNQTFATTQIIQITAVDLAYYKSSDDFEKRYKQLYAAGARMFTGSRRGAESYKAITLVDDVATSLSYSDIAKSLDADVREGRISKADAAEVRKSLKDINLADGQAFRTLDGFREVLDMMGRWTDALEDAYTHIKAGRWTPMDFRLVAQTIKPFVYTVLDKPDGMGSRIPVPYQVKDSESVILEAYMAVALGNTRGGGSSSYASPKLVGLARFMDGHGIRVAQFQSAVKVGESGAININMSHSKLRQWAAATVSELDKALASHGISQAEHDEAVSRLLPDTPINQLAEYFKETLDERLDSGEIDSRHYARVMRDMEPSADETMEILEQAAYHDGEEDGQVVDTIPYSGYMMAQPTPEDLVDKKAIVGTQFDNLITADLPEDMEITLGGRKLGKNDIIDLYNRIKIENLLDGFKKVRGTFADIGKLRDELVRMVLSTRGYGRNLVEALELVDVDDGNGTTHKEFSIPMNNPTTAASLARLAHSMFRNRIQRQEISGGACILVSSFGYTDRLRTIYNDDGSIRHFECYLPAYSRKLYEAFMEYDENGNPFIDPSKIPDELRRGIGYRIPTEDKYSMVHFYIKGFLPPFCGSKIMLPMEAMLFSGEDFDVDKKFLMLPAFKVDRYDVPRARRDFMRADASMEKAAAMFPGSVLERMFSEDGGAEDGDDAGGNRKEATEAWRKWWEAHKEEYRLAKPSARKIGYSMSEPLSRQSREARDNMMIDLAYKILQDRDTASKIQNPGGYGKVKREAYMYRILTDASLVRKWAEARGIGSDDTKGIGKSLATASVSDMRKFIDKNSRQRSPLVPSTFTYYHEQNMTGKKLVGAFAIADSVHAKYQGVGLSIKKEYRFRIDGIEYGELDAILAKDGTRTSKNLAECLAAAPDTAKDSVLADLNFNEGTASIVAFMLRAGMSIGQAALFLRQPLVNQWARSGQPLYVLAEIVKDACNDAGVRLEDVKMEITTDELLGNIVRRAVNGKSEYTEADVRAAAILYNIALSAADLNNITSVSRVDTPRGAISPTPAGLYRQELMVGNLQNPRVKEKMRITGYDGGLRNGVVNAVGDSVDEIRAALVSSGMPRLQAYHTLAVDSAIPLMKRYFPQYSNAVRGIVRRLDDNTNGIAVPETVISSAMRDLINFWMSGTELFGKDGNGNTFESKRRYYLYRFPRRFSQIVSSEPMKPYGALRRLRVNDKGWIVFDGNGKADNIEREQYQLDFERMLADKDDSVRAFAIDLFKYCYYRYGLSYSPFSFEGFFSAGFTKKVGGYVEALAAMSRELDNNPALVERFIAQFYANRYDLRGVVPVLKWRKDTRVGDDYRFQRKEVTSDKTGETFGRVMVRSRLGNTLLEFTGRFMEDDDNHVYAVYREGGVLRHGNSGYVVYDRNASLGEMLDRQDNADEQDLQKAWQAITDTVAQARDSFDNRGDGLAGYDADEAELAELYDEAANAEKTRIAPDTSGKPIASFKFDTRDDEDTARPKDDGRQQKDSDDDKYAPEDTVGFC